MTAHPSPGELMMLLTDKQLRTAVLDADPGDTLPKALRGGRASSSVNVVDPRWIGPVVEAVATRLPAFRDAFDDENAGSHKAQNRCRAEPSSRCR